MVPVGAEPTRTGTFPQPPGIQSFRFYVAHEPHHSTLKKLKREGTKMPVLFFFHGKQGSAWVYANEYTNWLMTAEKEGMIIAYGQAMGPLWRRFVKAPPNDFVCAGTFWESVGPSQDLRYVEAVIQDLHERYPGRIDTQRIWAAGFSSGALFSWNVMVKFGGTTFAAVANIMGGVQWSEKADNDFLKPIPGQPTCPLFLISGTNDVHLPTTRKAEEFAKAAGYSDIKVEIIQGAYHTYDPSVIEPMVLAWLKTKTLPATQS